MFPQIEQTRKGTFCLLHDGGWYQNFLEARGWGSLTSCNIMEHIAKASLVPCPHTSLKCHIGKNLVYNFVKLDTSRVLHIKANYLCRVLVCNDFFQKYSSRVK